MRFESEVYLVLDSDDAIEYDGAVTTLNVVEGVHGTVQADSADDRELGQGARRPSIRHLHVAHVVEIHGCYPSFLLA